MRWVLVLGLVACANDVEERQQAALAAAADAVPLVLVTAELLQHSTEPESETTTSVTGARHAGACGCPCVYPVGSEDSYVQELDYEQPSCVPVSDMLPARLGGHIWLDYDKGEVAASRAQAWLAPRALPDEEIPLDVDFDGVFDGKVDLWEATVSGAVSVGGREVAFDDLFIDLGRDVRFDGAVAGGRMVDLALPRRTDDAACPMPVEGRFELDGAVVTWGKGLMQVDVDGDIVQVDACERLTLP